MNRIELIGVYKNLCCVHGRSVDNNNKQAGKEEYKSNYSNSIFNMDKLLWLKKYIQG